MPHSSAHLRIHLGVKEQKTKNENDFTKSSENSGFREEKEYKTSPSAT